jgi:hypothetical protein
MPEFYSHGHSVRHFVTLEAMASKSILERFGLAGGLVREVILAALALLVGFGLMPILIFLAGSSALGRYDGASVGAMFSSLYQGFTHGSPASWIVLLGPYGLYLLFKGLRLW